MSGIEVYKKRFADRIIRKLHGKGISVDTGLAEEIINNKIFRLHQGVTEKFQYAYFRLNDAHIDGYVKEKNKLYLVCVESDPYAYLSDMGKDVDVPYLSNAEIEKAFRGLQRILENPEGLAAYRSSKIAELGRFLKSQKCREVEIVKFLLLTNMRFDEVDNVLLNIRWESQQFQVACEIWNLEKLYSLEEKKNEPEKPGASLIDAPEPLSEEEHAFLDEFCGRTHVSKDGIEAQLEIFKLGSVKLQQLALCLTRFAKQSGDEIIMLLERLTEAELPPKLDYWPNESEAVSLAGFAWKVFEQRGR